MIFEQIDLYSYFNLPKQDGHKGILSVYALEQNAEIGLSRKRSAILIMPGGGYAVVSPRTRTTVAMAYAKHGLCAFVLEYTVAPATFPTQLREAAMAMIFIRENAKKYAIDIDTVAAIGFSAGGHLCGCLGTMFNAPEVQDLPNAEFIRPTAIILSYPVTVSTKNKTHQDSFDNLTAKDEKLTDRLSLDKCVTKLSSPAFIWHTVTDELVPVYGSIALAQKYEEQGVPFELHLFSNGPHGLGLATKEFSSVNNEVCIWHEMSIAWLKKHGFLIYS